MTNGSADTQATYAVQTAAPAEQAVEVFDVNANLVGFAVSNPAIGTAQLISQAGSVIGSMRADQATGHVNVLGADGGVLGNLSINPVNNAVTLVPPAAPPSAAPATQAANAQTASSGTASTPADLMAPLHDDRGNVVGQVDINLSTGRVTLVGTVPVAAAPPAAAPPAAAPQAAAPPAAVPPAAVPPAAVPPAAAPPAGGTQAVTDAPVEVFDINGDRVGLAVRDPATGAVHLVSLGSVILGSIRADPRTGTLIVVADEVVPGQLGVDSATGKVTLVPSGTAG